MPGLVWVIGQLNCGTGLARFRIIFFLRPADPPPPLGAGGDLGTLATPTVAQDCMTYCFLFSVVKFRLAPLAKVVALPYFGFLLFRRHTLAPPPLFR